MIAAIEIRAQFSGVAGAPEEAALNFHPSPDAVSSVIRMDTYFP
jgi:hypothetical protein